MYRSDPKDWTRGILEPCTGDELEALCRLMGIPHSGVKGIRVTRLLDMANLRIELASWGEYQDDDLTKVHEKAHKIAEDICGRYKHVELVALAKRARTFYGLPKRGIILSLLQWRDRCRTRGQKFNSEIRQVTKIQYVLPGFEPK